MTTLDIRLFNPDYRIAREEAAKFIGTEVKISFVDEAGRCSRENIGPRSSGACDEGAFTPFRFRGRVVDVADWDTGHPKLLLKATDAWVLPTDHTYRVVDLDRVVDVEPLAEVVPLERLTRR